MTDWFVGWMVSLSLGLLIGWMDWVLAE